MCVFVRLFLGHFETDWETLWHTVAYRPRMSSKTMTFQHLTAVISRASSRSSCFKYYCFRTLPGAIGKFVPKGFPIGFEMAEKNVNRQTDKHFRIYVSRDNIAWRDEYPLYLLLALKTKPHLEKTNLSIFSE